MSTATQDPTLAGMTVAQLRDLAARAAATADEKAKKEAEAEWVEIYPKYSGSPRTRIHRVSEEIQTMNCGRWRSDWPSASALIEKYRSLATGALLDVLLSVREAREEGRL